MKRLALLLLLCTLPLYAAKQREWKDARLIEISSGDTGSVVVMPIGAGLAGARIWQTNFTFDTGDLIIIGADRGRKARNLTVNKSTKIAVENQKLYIIDDAGKELKLTVVGKRAK